VSTVRIALANLRIPSTPDESDDLACQAIADAAARGAAIVCFPECYVPGYRSTGKEMPPPDMAFLARAWASVADAARAAEIAVVLGTERIVDGQLRITALVIDRDGSRLGFQDKVQVAPEEESTYPGAGEERRLFAVGDLVFGVAICHEGWRYPETFRWAARRGAHVIFHPHFHEAEPGAFQPTTFGDPANTVHENAIRCRAAENECFVASVNMASEGSPTTSAIARPDGSILCHQPYGEEGVLIADIDLAEATGRLATRLKPMA
jgi:predicted amidohydrolase